MSLIHARGILLAFESVKRIALSGTTPNNQWEV